MHYVKCPRLSNKREEIIKIWQNLSHLVVEGLSCYLQTIDKGFKVTEVYWVSPDVGTKVVKVRKPQIKQYV